MMSINCDQKVQDPRVLNPFYSEKKTAFLKYLLQYQNYNANYTSEENKYLGYPNPIATPYRSHHYSRFASKQFAQALPFKIKVPFLICNKGAISTLKTLYPNISIPSKSEGLLAKVEKTWVAHIVPVPEDCPEKAKETAWVAHLDAALNEKYCPEKAKKIWVAHLEIVLAPEDCPEKAKKTWVSHHDTALNEKYCPEKTVQEAVQKFFKDKIFQQSSQKNKIQCIATVEIGNVDFSLLFSGAVNKGKSGYKIKFQKLSKIFDSSVGSLISNTGTFPDRMALIDFAPTLPPNTSSEDLEQNFVSTRYWESEIRRIRNKTFNFHPGCDLLRSVVLKWHDTFFSDPKILRFAKPLLSTQVAPFMDEQADIVQWAKAYQNLCEIVVFCLDTYPEELEHLRYEKKVETLLSKFNVHASVGLFPYAMTGIFYFLNHILSTLPRIEKDNFSALYLGSNYFETVEIIKKMVHARNFDSREISLIENIDKIPNILIADIHPNNAARARLVQNSFSSLCAVLEKNKKKQLTLILDVTLNHLEDPLLNKTLTMLLPFIQRGQLTILGIQSLAKLMQFGADNFSGGLAFCLTSNEKSEAMPKFTSSIKRKSAFFALTHDLFTSESSQYIDLVRYNTLFTYKHLQKLFLEIQQQNTHKRHPFCAAYLIQNTDENTVYVAINLSLLLEAFYPEKSERSRERCVNKLRELLLAYSQHHKLHITGRQSFGFTLSNMSSVCEAIRFSVGIESEEELISQCELIATFIDALTKYHCKYVVDTPSLNDFEQKFRKALSLTYGTDSFSKEYNFYEERCDIDGNDELYRLGKSSVKCEKNQVILNAEEDESGKQHTHLLKLSSFELLLFNFSLVANKNNSCWMALNHYTDNKLALFPEDLPYLFCSDASSFEQYSKLEIQYNPLTINQFTANQLYIIDEEFGEKPVQVGMLNKQSQNRIFTKIHRYHIWLQKYEQNSVLIHFHKRKEFINYSEKIESLLAKDLDKDFTPLVDWLNSLDFDHLPLEHDATWRQLSNPKNTLKKFLHLIAHEITPQFHKFWGKIKEVEQLELKVSFLKGVLSYLMNETTSLSDDTVSKIKDAFSPVPFLKWECITSLTSWILGKKIEKQPLSTFETLFPLIKHAFCSLGHFESIANAKKLKEIAEAKKHSPINDYFFELEAICLENTENLTFLLELFIRYPFTEEQKAKLIQRVKSLNIEKIDKWLQSPNFFFHGIGQDRLDLGHSNFPEYETMFYESEQGDINTFLSQTGLLNRLFYLAENENMSLKRWYEITEHPSMHLAMPL
ncbi:MAG: hypothetical protein SNF33_02750 [Candidatus Algichlamydia australiensis]|nr:hypothetical protein [Chlamydiales bacterium]